MTILLEPSTTVPGSDRRRTRHYLMCRPEYFEVSYAINPWMDTTVPVDVDLAVKQWEQLRQIYLDLGHTVELIPPVPGLPDMVYAANGALVVDGHAYGARFAHPQRFAEGPAYLAHLRDSGLRSATEAHQVNEGEGDFLVVGDLVLAGTGFRTDPAAHQEAQELLGRPVITLRLIDPRFYHLDTALAVLDDNTVAYYPGAFSAGSRAVLRTLFPDAILATAEDAAVLGLNAVSDGHNVVLTERATGFIAQLRERGYNPIGVDLSELFKGGGSVKCCTLELRS
ncbi:dimethylargininase [Pseudonocardia spinosispora]|uniref:dimethylargininase n=1 Tax=Pseudonocardia spinosispora TaxID=103441 RepID=UPI00040E6B22|nr:dimethylargininase [Pseudonocardia spinosispora]